MSKAEEIRVIITGDARGLNTEMGQSLRKAKGFARDAKARIEAVTATCSKYRTAAASVETANNGTAASFTKAGNSAGLYALKLSAVYLALRVVTKRISNWINESTDYVENVNLFTASMGEYAKEAKKYAENVSEIMGIDPSDWMRNQGVFMTLASGFGVASDSANRMSKNLTQLGYDISSFFNVSVEDAMQKLQSGLSGELEPLRRLGYDLSQTKLKAIALAHGIDKSVESMTQAEMSQLRYYAIMTQVTTAQGDMARTLEAPANQLRIFKAQITQTARALGNIFIPALNAVLPYAIAFLKVIRMIADGISSLFGFKLPEIDYSGLKAVTGSTDKIGDSLDDATKSAKALNRQLSGFDELNVISSQKKAGSGSEAGGGELDIELPEYDFLGNLIESRIAEIVDKIKAAIDKVKLFFKEIKDMIPPEAVEKFVKAWEKLKKAVQKFLDAIDWERLKKIIQVVIASGITLVLATLTGIFSGLAAAINVVTDAIKLFQASFSDNEMAKFEALRDLIVDIANLLVSPFLPIIDVIFGTDFSTRWDEYTAKLKEAETWSELFQTGWDGIKQIFTDIWTWIDENIVQPCKKAEESLRKAFGLTELYEQVKSTFAQIWSTLKAVWDKIAGFFTPKKGSVVAFFTEIWELIKAAFAPTVEFFKGLFSTAWTAIKTTWNSAVSFFTLVWAGIEFVFAVVEGVLTGDFSSAWEAIKNVWEKAKGFFETVWSGIQTVFGKVKEWFSSTFSAAIESVKTLFNGWLDFMRTAVNLLIGWINDKFTLSWRGLTIAGKEIIPAGSFAAIKIPLIPELVTGSGRSFATGGFPEDGLFFANHNEMVGSFSNGRTAVANNEQIVDGIARGVASAQQEQNALLREEITVLKAILAKSGITSRDVFNAARSEDSAYMKRTGKSAFGY